MHVLAVYIRRNAYCLSQAHSDTGNNFCCSNINCEPTNNKVTPYDLITGRWDTHIQYQSPPTCVVFGGHEGISKHPPFVWRSLKYLAHWVASPVCWGIGPVCCIACDRHVIILTWSILSTHVIQAPYVCIYLYRQPHTYISDKSTTCMTLKC